jgi:hypothetical protein
MIIRRMASSERALALPPSEAIRRRSAADNRRARARPPRLPNSLAISDVFMTKLYLALSMWNEIDTRLAVGIRRPAVLN